jgi:S-adenosylmethionine:tRNA ribosyltransferase-isomerase
MNYNYNLPSELIAHEPAEPRDSARLMVYSTKTDEIMFDTFAHIARYIPENSILVLNDTRVVPARIECTRITGGTVRILFLLNEWDGGMIVHGLPDKKVEVGDTLYIHHRPFAQATTQLNEDFGFKLLISPADFEKLYTTHGRTPLPPYINSNTPEEQVRDKYQTIFAHRPASVAAPTASLHFTDRVFESLREKEIENVYVTLHVGRGTFSPVTKKILDGGALHKEPVHISYEASQAISAAKKSGKTIVTSGTTAVRVLESFPEQIMTGNSYDGETALLIKPPYEFKLVDALITNFHIPNTSLLMLVDAFLQSKGAHKTWRDLYDLAIKEKFKFYSFGDAMLIL